MIRYKKICISTHCNNKCLHCCANQEISSYLDSNTIIASLKQKEEDSVLFYGGEPTLRRDLFDIILAAQKNGYRRIKLLTNGRAFSDIQLLQKLIHAGCYLFEIKLWASRPDLHDRITQTPQSFQETMSGLENLVRLPQEKFISVRILLCKENYVDIENTVAMVLNFRINRIILSFQDYSIAFKYFIPHIKNAINISILNRVWIVTEGLPFCIMQGMENHVGEIYSGWDTLYKRLFKQHAYCADCVYREVCPGVEARYLKQFGEKEFTPLTASKHFRDIRALL